MDPPFPNLESSSAPSTSRKKRRKTVSGDIAGTGESPVGRRERWRTDAVQRAYESRLAAAVRQIRRSSGDRSSGGTGGGGRTVREAADRVLAAAARGRTRWSRAILSRRLHRHRKARVTATAVAAPRRLPLAPPRSSPPSAAERRARVLARLVPGCKKLPFPSLLEEATDYIAALQMQVRAMTALTQLLAGAGAAPAPPG